MIDFLNYIWLLLLNVNGDIKFRGVKLPGGLELNGREIYDDAVRELEYIKEKMSTEYEIPPLDAIG